MKILLYADQTVGFDLDLEKVRFGLGATTDLSVDVGRSRFEMPSSSIRYPKTHKHVAPELLAEVASVDLAVCATRIPYQNNYFFQSAHGLAIVSFYGWEKLTSLPVENGLVYFIADLLCSNLPPIETHDETTGCINDFLWDKTGVDIGMRSGRICPDCREKLERVKLRPAQFALLANIDRILSDISAASRAQQSILDYWDRKQPTERGRKDEGFDVFLCHNSEDKEEVRGIAGALTAQGIRVWLDEDQLRPGLPWQDALEEQIESISTAAVFVGASGVGPWQNIEIRAFISEFAQRGCPVIPVILPMARTIPELPLFLRQLTWVDFRDKPQKTMERLIWGITGRRPGDPPPTPRLPAPPKTPKK